MSYYAFYTLGKNTDKVRFIVAFSVTYFLHWDLACSPGWSVTYTDPLDSASRELWLKACTTILDLVIRKILNISRAGNHRNL